MELKLNSWYVKLWKYTYSHRLPNNLCLLFWQLVVAILLFIPNIIFRIPVNIMNYFSSPWNQVKRGDARTGIGIIMYLLFFATIIICFTTYNWFLWAINSYSYDYAAATMGGTFLIVGLFFLIRAIWLHYDTGYKIIAKTNNNIVVNYIDAWYNNHCPKIDWKDKE